MVRSNVIFDTVTGELAQIASSLLYTVARFSQESILAIDAAMHDDIIFLVISCNNTKNRYSALHEFQHLKLPAKKMDGLLDINYGSKKTIISFGFKNNTATKKRCYKRDGDCLTCHHPYSIPGKLPVIFNCV